MGYFKYVITDRDRESGGEGLEKILYLIIGWGVGQLLCLITGGVQKKILYLIIGLGGWAIIVLDYSGGSKHLKIFHSI